MKLHRNARLSVKGRELLGDRVENAVRSRPNYVHLNRNTRRRAPVTLLDRSYWSSFRGRRMSGRAPLWACPCRGPLLDQRLPDVPSRCP